MEDLPIPVTVDILSRLPVKTIIHCKCVCKKWLDLISDPYFAKIHLSRSPATLKIHDYPETILFDDNDSLGRICAFGFENETFELFPSPPYEARDKCCVVSLGILKGCLCRCDRDMVNFSLMVWVMKEYGIKKSWHKELVIDINIGSDLYIWRLMIQPMYIIQGLEDGTILMVFLPKTLLVYCPQRKTIVNMETFCPYFKGFTYRPSFHRLHNLENERVHVF